MRFVYLANAFLITLVLSACMESSEPRPPPECNNDEKLTKFGCRPNR